MAMKKTVGIGVLVILAVFWGVGALANAAEKAPEISFPIGKYLFVMGESRDSLGKKIGQPIDPSEKKDVQITIDTINYISFTFKEDKLVKILMDNEATDGSSTPLIKAFDKWLEKQHFGKSKSRKVGNGATETSWKIKGTTIIITRIDYYNPESGDSLETFRIEMK